MRRFLTLMVATIFLFVGCGGNSNSKTEQPPPKPVEQSEPAPKELTPEEIAAKEAKHKAEEERRLAEKKAAEEKRAAEIERNRQIAEENKRRLEEEQAEREAQIVDEQIAFQNWEAIINSGINSVDDHWENLWQYTLISASNGEIGVQTLFLTLRELEHKLIDDEMIFYNATIPGEMSSDHSKKMKAIKQGFESWAKLRRKACENFRFAVMDSSVTPQVIQESIDIINQADTFMLLSTAELEDLKNEIEAR